MIKILINFIFVLCLLPVVTSDCTCDDNVHNVVQAHSNKKLYPARISGFAGAVYDADFKPSCHDQRPNVLLPGFVTLTDGKLIVDRDFDLEKDSFLRLTIHGVDFDDPICLNGTSQYVVLPDNMCRINLCEFIGVPMCKILQKKGTHTLKELQKKLNFNTTLELPEPPSLLGLSLLDLFSGEFSFTFAVETAGETILELDIPTNHKNLQIGLED
uniref:Uncharacterized protein n=1 Tax=Panagrellus redivivus TaxID=6233 RepID=A0A7E4VFA2_PANRE